MRGVKKRNFVTRITADTALNRYLSIIKTKHHAGLSGGSHKMECLKMMTFTAIQSILVAIAAHASVFVTNPVQDEQQVAGNTVLVETIDVQATRLN